MLLGILTFSTLFQASHTKTYKGEKKEQDRVFSHLVFNIEKEYNWGLFIMAITYKLNSYYEIILIFSVLKNNRKRLPLNTKREIFYIVYIG